MRALLVDDSEEVRMATAWGLSQEGFDTAVVTLGRDVPGRIKSFQPDVLILDLWQPDTKAITIARLLREDWPELPIIVSTVRNGETVQLPTRTEFLAKPYSVEELVEAIVRLIYSPSSDL